MKLKKFVKDYDMAPYELHLFAAEAARVTDGPELKSAAEAYLEARENFINVMLENGVEQG